MNTKISIIVFIALVGALAIMQIRDSKVRNLRVKEQMFQKVWEEFQKNGNKNLASYASIERWREEIKKKEKSFRTFEKFFCFWLKKTPEFILEKDIQPVPKIFIPPTKPVNENSKLPFVFWNKAPNEKRESCSAFFILKLFSF